MNQRVERYLEKAAASRITKYLRMIPTAAKPEANKISGILDIGHRFDSGKGATYHMNEPANHIAELHRDLQYKTTTNPTQTLKDMSDKVGEVYRSERAVKRWDSRQGDPLNHSLQDRLKEYKQNKHNLRPTQGGPQTYAEYHQVDPDSLIPFGHGGGNKHIQGFLNNSTSSGYKLEHDNTARGIQVHPDRSQTYKTREVGYAGRSWGRYIDAPAQLTGTIPAKYLIMAPNKYEAGILKEHAQHIKDIDIKDLSTLEHKRVLRGNFLASSRH